MAFDPLADNHHHLLDSLPLIDLRLLSQSELYSLSLCSFSSTSHPNRRCDDDVLIPKIDRSIFNESAGSRKQTYSRLRLAPRNSQFASSRVTSITRQNPEPLDQENVQVVGVLKQLFASGTHEDLVPVRIEDFDSVPEPSFNFMQSIPIGVVVDNALKKRKRGRPRKDANLAIENYSEKKNYDNGSLKREGTVLPVSSNMVLCNSQDSIISGGIQPKRKRGRPPKNEKRAVEDIKGGDKANATCEESKEVLENVNRNGSVVDLVALGNKSTPSIVDQSAVVGIVSKSSIGTINGTKVVDAEICKDSRLNIAFSSKDSGIDAGTISHMEQEVSSKGCSLVSSSNANEHILVLKNNAICNSKMEELKQNIGSSENDQTSCSGYARSYYVNMNDTSPSLIEESINNEVKSFWNNEELHAFGSFNTGIDANPVTSIQTGQRYSEGLSPAILGTDQSISSANTVPGVCIGTMEELNLTRVCEIDLVCPSGSEKIDAIGNNICSVNSSRLWEQPKSADLERSRNDEQMIGRRIHTQPSGDVAAELIWTTTEQNVQQSRLVDTSSALMQLSGCSPNFDMSSNKDAYGVLGNNESYERISGFEGMRLGSIRPSEYHILTSQGASDSNESKVMSYDAEVGQGFDSSVWLEKEVSSLLTKTGSTHQAVVICAWCRNEFQHDYVNPETHSDSGSVGLMCGTCQAKFSSDFNPL